MITLRDKLLKLRDQYQESFEKHGIRIVDAIALISQLNIVLGLPLGLAANDELAATRSSPSGEKTIAVPAPPADVSSQAGQASIGLVNELEREIMRLNKEYADLLRHFDMYINAWQREIGGYIRAKHHQIDGFVLRTQDALKEEYERGKAESLVAAPSAGSGQELRPPRTVGCTAGADCVHECPVTEPEARLDEFKTTVIAMLDPELTGEQKKVYIAARGKELRELAALLPPASKPPATLNPMELDEALHGYDSGNCTKAVVLFRINEILLRRGASAEAQPPLPRLEQLIELRSLWMERAKKLRTDSAYTDCAVTLESCADELSSLFRSAQ